MTEDKPTLIARLAPYLLLAFLGLVFFGPLVQSPTSTLYSDASDFIVEHVPAKHFLVESWRETGQLPQWCPYNFGGMPFQHDTQVAAFYPPHAILYVVPARLIGPVLSWLTVAHVILAGWGMHAYARRRGLGAAGALVAALVFMFAGKWLMHVLAAGHIVQLGVAWVPFVLLFLEEAMRRKSLLHATLAGVFFSLIVLSAHPQISFYSGVFIALWTIETGRVVGWKRWLVCGGMTALIAVGLSAVEWLPTVSAARLASRWGGTAEHGIGADVRNVLQLFGPFLGNMRHEPQSGIGVLVFALAGLALYITPRRARWPALVFVILAVFSFGGGALLRGLPGVSLFRLPTRMMQLAALPLALLAGMSGDALLGGLGWTPSLRRRCLTWIGFVAIVGIALVLLGGHYGSAMDRVKSYAITAAIALSILAGLVLTSKGHGSPSRAALVVVIVLADLWTLAWGLVQVRPEAEIYQVSSSVEYLADHRDEHGRVLDRDAAPASSTSPLGTGTPLALLHRLEPVRGYEPLDVQRYKEFLELIEDRDTPLRAGENFTMPALIDFPLVNLSLLDLLGVRYVLQLANEVPASPTWEVVHKDDSPVGYEMSGRATAGVQIQLPYVVYRNPKALPRVFVVSEAAPLPDRPRVLSTMKQTDFRKRVLLEDFTPPKEAETPNDDSSREAQIVSYEPDRVEIRVADGPAGWLVLTDVWYPGWTCTVNGKVTPIHRADFLFRAVPVSAGIQEVVFTFALPKYEFGKRLSALALAFVIAVVMGSAIWPRLRGSS
jgi:hypothetical protein